MQVTKNISFGQLYAQWNNDEVRIPTQSVEAFLEDCGVSKADKQALDRGDAITINRPFNLACYYQG